MSRINEIKHYIRTEQARINELGTNDKILLECMIDELRQEHGIETIIGSKVTFKPLAKRYTEVTAITDLPSSHYLYEAQIDLKCSGCGKIIPANSYFGRKVPQGCKMPMPHCRTCRPLKIYTSPQRTGVAPLHDEYLYVSEAE